MRFSQVGLSAFICLLAVSSTSLGSSLLTIFTTSQVLAQTVDTRKTEADRLFDQGLERYKMGQREGALKLWQQALQIYRNIKDRKAEVISLGNMGRTYLDLDDYLQAIDHYQQSLAIAREIKDRRSERGALGNLGTAYFSLGKYPQAIEYQQQSLALARETKDRQGEIYALLNLGNAYGISGNSLQAIDYYQQGLAAIRETKDRESEGKLLGNLGLVYNSLGDYPQAIEKLQQSLAIAKEIKNRQDQSYVLGNLGMTYRKLGDYPKAIEYHQQSLALAREVKDRNAENKSLGSLGTVYNILGNYPKAIDYYQQSVVIAKAIKDRNSEGESLGGLGNVYTYLGNYAKAIDYHQQSLVVAREIKDRESESKALNNLGIAYKELGNYPKAIEYQQQSLKIAREIKDREGEGNSLNNLGLSLYKQGNLPLAERNLFEGIKIKESLRSRELKDSEKVLIFETQRGTYNTLQQVLTAQNKTNTALEISERGRARAFVELLASRISANPNSQSPTSPNIDQIKQIAKSQNTTLVQYSIIYDQFKIAEKQEVKESELYIWVIKSTGEVTFRKADLKPLWQKENTTLNDLVTTSRESIGARGTAFRGINVVYNPDAPKATNRLKRLHELLINPIADLLPKNPQDRVTFIPQSSLFLVPFPALQGADGKYLIEKHTILTSPSIQVLDLTRKQKKRIGNKPIQGNNMLIVGNPTMPAVSPKIGEAPQQLTPLPGAEREAKAIANLFKTQSLIGERATETEVTQRLSQAQFIHLATHGLFDNIQGLNSSIALAPGNKSDGLLTAGEILDLKLNAELVVLSACDTGRGSISGDGVIGLSRSLISAGVPSVLVSLWSVPDAPTALLMTEFYQNISKSPDKAQALRQAMLTTMKQHPNPVDWGAFTLIGEAE
ncbi:CHAT domain-containing tetratricopeptide repeat protein [Calothrix sp. PCC 7507]|uniref:CHAT domain-containing protein n=1 Tax=Calothrix sp. PCC 7507 TaxID=99598 RepID=UPI00029F3785|nr:CHAT domain-containing tetratricopeptide repeat protein [Calothrix sp. PCC 7507]AFY31639.1 Tetratricopeptide TPR_1 repeat-containing protein [Calothrix sp. PCC 7507]